MQSLELWQVNARIVMHGYVHFGNMTMFRMSVMIAAYVKHGQSPSPDTKRGPARAHPGICSSPALPLLSSFLPHHRL